VDVLQKLVTETDFFNLPDSPSAQTRADGFQYSISVQADGKQRSLHFSDSSMPETLQPLISDLMGRARSQRR
jgi:hypothetical protein